MGAKELGMEEVPAIRIEHLSEAEKRAYILADNKLAEKAGWDKDILAIELQELMVIEEDFDITLTGFETPEIDLILDVDNDLGEPDEYLSQDIPEACKKGDLWQLGEHKLLIGDSLFDDSYHKLLGNELVDMVPSAAPPDNASTGSAKYRGSAWMRKSDKDRGQGANSRKEFTEFAYAG